MPFDIASAGDEGYIIKVDDLETDDQNFSLTTHNGVP